MKALKLVWFIPRNILCFLIKIYQKTLSPDHGILRYIFPNGYCKFQPTCSYYAYDAIKKKGVIKGLILSFYRVIRCNPWNEGGYDPVRK